MNYRALFIGGPIDGQERVTQQAVDEIAALGPQGENKYRLLFMFGDNEILYSVYDVARTLELLFDSYSRFRIPSEYFVSGE